MVDLSIGLVHLGSCLAQLVGRLLLIKLELFFEGLVSRFLNNDTWTAEKRKEKVRKEEREREREREMKEEVNGS